VSREAERFVTSACLCYEDPHYDHRSFHARANEMLRANPELADADIWSAATAGNAVAVGRFLDEDPNLANQPGPNRWIPLICACYSRVGPTLEAAKVLLDRGADPNSYNDRNYYGKLRFTALAGVFGGGDTGIINQPPHPQWRELAELLLDRGADPCDATVVQIAQSRELTRQKLEVLVRHGLTPDARTKQRQADPKTATITLMGLALAMAAIADDAETVRLLLAQKARSDERFGGKTAWHHAMVRGNLGVAKLLEDAGSPVTKLSDVESFVSLCLAADETAARSMIHRDRDLLQKAPKDLVRKAVETRRKAAVLLALDFAFDPNWVDENSAIHAAGVLSEHEEILEILLARGASLKLRDPFYDSTGAGWADFMGEIRLRDRLLDGCGICLFDALDFDRLDRISSILARDPDALERPFAKCLTRKPKAEDWQTPLVRMVARGKTGAVRALINHGADTGARHPDGRSPLQIAQGGGFQEIVDLLEMHPRHG